LVYSFSFVDLTRRFAQRLWHYDRTALFKYISSLIEDVDNLPTQKANGSPDPRKKTKLRHDGKRSLRGCGDW